jgi:hypothetical protein
MIVCSKKQSLNTCKMVGVKVLGYLDTYELVKIYLVYCVIR